MPDLVPLKSRLQEIQSDTQKLVDGLTKRKQELEKHIEKNLVNDEIINSTLTAELKNQLFSTDDFLNFDAQCTQINAALDNVSKSIPARQEIIQTHEREQQAIATNIAQLLGDNDVDALSDATEEHNNLENTLIAEKKQLEQEQVQKTALENLLKKLAKEKQQLQSQIVAIQTLHTRLNSENIEILGIDNTVSLEAANKKLTAIHNETLKLIPEDDVAALITIRQKKIATDLKTIQEKRSNILSDLIKNVQDEESVKDTYNDFQRQIAALSGKPGGAVGNANNVPADPDDVEKLLNKLKMQRQYKSEGGTIHLRADGSLQGPDNPTMVKLRVDLRVLLTKEKHEQVNKERKANNLPPLPQPPVKLYFTQYDSGSEEAHIIGMKHALAHGVDHAKIINPDKEGKKWNKIFDAYFDPKPDPNNKKLFSEKAESKYTRLIRQLDLENEVESKDLIQKTLSALEPEQISRILEDLSISNNDAELFAKTSHLVPKTLKERWDSDVKKTFSGLNNANQAKLLEACIEREQQKLSNRVLSWFSSEIKVPKYIAKMLEEIPRADIALTFVNLERDNVKEALAKTLKTTPEALTELAENIEAANAVAVPGQAG